MIAQDDPAATPTLEPGDRAFTAAVELVCAGHDDVARYLLAFGPTTTALRDARLRCLTGFGDRATNRGVLLRALALIDAALDRLGAPAH